MEVVLDSSKPDLFITVRESLNTKELFRLKDGRNKNSCIELDNRFFVLKWKYLLHDILKNEIFGEVRGHISVIE